MVENNKSKYMTKSLEIESVNDDYTIVGPNKDIDFIATITNYGTADLENDVIEQGAFAKGIDAKPNIPFLFNHNANFSENILGGAFIYEIGDRVIAEIRLNKNNATSDVIRESINQGYLTELSVGFSIKSQSYRDPEQPYSGGVLIQSAYIYEVSLVLRAANQNAVINPEDNPSMVKALTVQKIQEIDEDNQVQVNTGTEKSKVDDKKDDKNPDDEKYQKDDKKPDDEKDQKDEKNTDDEKDQKDEKNTDDSSDKSKSLDDIKKSFDDLKKSFDDLKKENNLLKEKIELLSEY